MKEEPLWKQPLHSLFVSSVVIFAFFGAMLKAYPKRSFYLLGLTDHDVAYAFSLASGTAPNRNLQHYLQQAEQPHVSLLTEHHD